MRKINFLLAFIFSGLILSAQNYGAITKEYFTFSGGEKEVMKTTFEKVNANQVEQALKEYLKNYKVKLEGVKGADNEFVVNELAISDINQNETTMDIKITELEGNASLYIHYLTNGKIVSKDNTPSEYDGYVQFTEALAKKATFIAFEDLIKTEEGVLKDKEKELKGLEKDEKKAHDEIGKANKSIKDSEVAIKALEGELKNQQTLVANKTAEVSAKEAEIAGVNVKSLESNIKDIEKDNKSLTKDIEKDREEVGEINAEIVTAGTELETHRKAIEAQKEVLAVTADKKTLKKIKTMEKDEAKMIGEIEGMKSEITNIETGIQTKLATIEANKMKIVDIEKQMAEHNEDALKDQLKILEKDLKQLEGDEKSIIKNIEKENGNITKQEENIRQAEAEIEKLKADQAAKKTEIEGVKTAIKTLQSTQASFK